MKEGWNFEQIPRNTDSESQKRIQTEMENRPKENGKNDFYLQKRRNNRNFEKSWM